MATPADWKERGDGKMSAAQQRMLNAVCGDLAAQLHWRGNRLGKDGWRHLLSAVAAGQMMLPGWDYHDGTVLGIIMLGKSSLSLTKTEAAVAITMGVALGDDPSDQHMDAKPVAWCDAVLHGLGFNPADLAA